MDSKKGLVAIIIILLLLLMGVGFWAYKTNKAVKTEKAKNAELSSEINGLNSLKDKLTMEVDSLQSAYAELELENETLQGTIEENAKTITAKDAAIRRAKRQAQKETAGLKAQIEQLLSEKSQLESSIYSLQAENDSLRNVTGQLTADLASAKSENKALAKLNATIQDELKALTLANFKASAFRVEVEKNRPKATAKSRRAKRVLVSFDLTGVSPKYQGVRPLYLVITDDKGTPIKNSNPINAQVTVNGQMMDIQAVKQQNVDIEENQRLSFSHQLESRLKRGYYRVAVYTDIGLLGAASFRLR